VSASYQWLRHVQAPVADLRQIFQVPDDLTAVPQKFSDTTPAVHPLLQRCGQLAIGQRSEFVLGNNEGPFTQLPPG
jgi:hypothetical protein